VQLLRNQAVIAEELIVADSFMKRFFGLMGRRNFLSGQGMYFPQCQSVHMWFMRIPLDIIFVKTVDTSNKKLIITSLHSSVRPWKLFPLLDLKAKAVLELPMGTISHFDLIEGDQLCIS